MLNDLVWFDYCSQIQIVLLCPQMLGSWGRISVEGRESVPSIMPWLAAAVSVASSAQASVVAAVVTRGVRGVEFG